MKRTLCLLLCLLLSMTVLLAGCGEGEESSAPAVSGEESKAGSSVTEKDIRATNLLKNVTVRDVDFTAVERPYHPLMTDLALKLAQQAQEKAGEDNMLISPLSILYAMAMVSNGAVDTEAVERFWGGVDTGHLNEFMSEYASALPVGEKYKLSLANSIWFTEKHGFVANGDFLQTMADYYKAGAYQGAFDQTTCEDINNWVEQNTLGMVKDILDRIPEDAVMYLVNALAFEAEWQKTYEETQVREGIFTTADGEKQTVQMMHSEENVYLEDANATGFLKYYVDQKYAFVALLPKEGMSVEEYLATLTGESLQEMLENPVRNMVLATMPAFETEFDMDLHKALGDMGYPVDGRFDGLGTSPEGNVTLGRILHKTYITVGPQGTKAGAATVVEAVLESAPMYEELKYVTLDRPFVYMIIDTAHNTPIFVGTVNEIDG